MRNGIQTAPGQVRGKWFFLVAFSFACFLFWWLPSIFYRTVVHRPDTVENQAIATSVLALCLFAAGFLLPTAGSARTRFSAATLDDCGAFAFKASVLLFAPALIIAAVLYYRSSGVVYGSADAIPGPFQALLYTHLFFGFMYLGAADPARQGWRRTLTVVLLVTLPRLIESLHGGRFFLAQAVVPAILIATARGWVRFSARRVMQLAALAVVLVLVPPLTRGDEVIGQEETLSFFAAGGSLRLYQNNTDLDLSGRCPPLLVSLTAKVIPYGLLGMCVIDFDGIQNMPATLSRILTINDPTTFGGTVAGTGSNYMLELHLLGGLPAVYAGSALFGFICRRFIGWIGMRSLFSGIWAECLTRALFAPRGDLGYVFERIPSLVLTTLLVILVVRAWGLLQVECSNQFTMRGLVHGGTAE